MFNKSEAFSWLFYCISIMFIHKLIFYLPALIASLKYTQQDFFLFTGGTGPSTLKAIEILAERNSEREEDLNSNVTT